MAQRRLERVLAAADAAAEEARVRIKAEPQPTKSSSRRASRGVKKEVINLVEVDGESVEDGSQGGEWEEQMEKAARERHREKERKEMLRRLYAARLVTCKDFLSCTELELIESLDLPQSIVRQLMLTVGAAAAPQPMPVVQLRRRSAVPTMLPGVDKALYGGIRSGIITELVGPAGVGKTQFCHQLAVMACIGEGTEEEGMTGSVAYIDTEGAFTPKRLVEILSKRFPHYGEAENVEALLAPLMKRVHVLRVNNSADMTQTLNSLEDMIMESGIRLLIVDSVAAIVRRDFDEGSIVQRQASLAAQAATLKRLAQDFNVAVLVTNQVVAASQPAHFEFDRNVNNALVGPRYVTAALGHVWGHAVNTRMVLEFRKGGINSAELVHEPKEERLLTIAKSPMCSVLSFAYYIDSAGIHQLGQVTDATGQAVSNALDAELDEVDAARNFWDRCISTRPEAAPGLQTSAQHYALFTNEF